MKNVVLFVLLLAAFATVSAHAITGPRFGVLYVCDYSDNHTGSALDPGWSFWQKRAGSATLIYTNETFQTSWGSDTYMSSWSNPVDVGYPYYYTRWEHMFRYGTRCTDTRVWGGGTLIQFMGCSDGQSRSCWTEAP